MLTREQLIDAILELNSTATVEYLMSFDTIDLRRYLERLTLTQGPRDRGSVWVRPKAEVPLPRTRRSAIDRATEAMRQRLRHGEQFTGSADAPPHRVVEAT